MDYHVHHQFVVLGLLENHVELAVESAYGTQLVYQLLAEGFRTYDFISKHGVHINTRFLVIDTVRMTEDILFLLKVDGPLFNDRAVVLLLVALNFDDLLALTLKPRISRHNRSG